MKKICVVIVNRANYGRVKLLLHKIKKNKKLKLQLILASSTLLKNYGRLDKIISKDGFKINKKFFNHISGENNETMAKSVGLLTIELSSVFNELKPDLVLTIADRYETLATATAASYMNICLAHLQGGELTGSIDESVRHAITKLSHIHLTCTNNSKKRVIQMGENPKKVFNVGCPSIDHIKKINFSKKLSLEKYKFGVGYRVDLSKKYIVVMMHPITNNLDETINNIKNTLSAILKINIPCVWFWPNIDAGSNRISNYIRSFREKNPSNKINFYTNFEIDDFLKLINKSECLIGNSSSGIRESSFLKVPVVNIGSRQDRRERGDNVLDTNNNTNNILKSISKQLKRKNIKTNKIYGNGNSSQKILKIINTVNLDINKKFRDI
jgi:bifunctional UDP-N-acetylglucosamine 2-epimerase / N-acetylmannosamine kinase